MLTYHHVTLETNSRGPVWVGCRAPDDGGEEGEVRQVRGEEGHAVRSGWPGPEMAPTSATVLALKERSDLQPAPR